MRGPWVLALLAATLRPAAAPESPLPLPLAALAGCSSERELAVSMTYSTNATGHRVVSASLEQPLRSAGWLLDVEVRTAASGGCAEAEAEAGAGAGAAVAPRRSLTVTLRGPPEGEDGAMALGAAPARSAAHPGYLTLPGLGHYRSPPEAKTWFEARDHCRREGGGLVTPQSRSEVVLLLGHFSTNVSAYYTGFFWHSANDIQEEGKFVTYDGVPLEDVGFAEFGPSNPTFDSDDNCLGISRDSYLYDLECYQTASFICKLPL